MSMKNPLTPAEIELATFRFVAQHLNDCATAVLVYHHYSFRKVWNRDEYYDSYVYNASRANLKPNFNERLKSLLKLYLCGA